MDPHTKLLYEKLTDSVCKQVSHIIYELGKNNTSSFWTAKHILLFAYSVFSQNQFVFYVLRNTMKWKLDHAEYLLLLQKSSL